MRSAAESRLRIVGPDAAGAGLDREKLIHELQVNQVELEMQNEELHSAHAEIARGFVRYQRLFDLAPVSCVTLDRSGRVQTCNHQAENLLGVGRRDLTGQPLQKFMPELSADIFHRHLRAVFARSARQTCKIVLERHGARPGSFPVRVESIVVPDEAGKRMLCQSVIMNFREGHEGLRTSGLAAPTIETVADAIAGSEAKADTELLQTTEEQLATLREQHDFAERLLATAPAILLVLDLDGCIVRFNDYCEQVTGYSLKEVRGDDWFATFLPGDDQELVRAAYARTLRGEIPSGTINPIRTKQGSDVAIEWHHTLLRDARAMACGSLSIGLDVTRRR